MRPYEIDSKRNDSMENYQIVEAKLESKMLPPNHDIPDL